MSWFTKLKHLLLLIAFGAFGAPFFGGTLGTLPFVGALLACC
jgi:hypothetical protein